MEHSANQVLEQNMKPVCSGGQIIQGTLLVQGPLDHCMYRCIIYKTHIFQLDALPHAPPPESQLGLVEFQPVFELGLVPGPRPLH